MRPSIRRALSLPLALTLALPLALPLVAACGASASPQPQEAVAPEAPPIEIAPDPAAGPTAASPAETATPADDYSNLAGIRYVEMTTGDADPTATLPMIIAIHGLGDRPENFVSLLGGLPEPARVILPAGILPNEGGFSWFDVRARSRDVEALAAGIDLASDKLAIFIDAIAAQRPTVGKPIVTGFSQGGMLSFAIAAGHPASISAAYPVSGWLPPPLWPEAGPEDPSASPPIVALHGDADNAVLIEPTRLAVEKLKELGYPVVLHEYPEVRHQITAQMRSKLWALVGAGTKQLAEDRAIAPEVTPTPEDTDKRPMKKVPKLRTPPPT